MKKISFFRKQGFSIVEVMVAAGIMGVVTLGLNKLTETQFKTVKTVESSSEVTSILTQMKTILATSESCEATFVTNPANSGNPYRINQGALSDPMAIRQLSPSSGSIVDKFIANTNKSLARKYGNGGVKILSYSLSTSDSAVGITAGDTVGTTHLLVRFYRGKGTLGNEEIVKKIILNVERVSPTNNRIATCSTSSAGVGAALASCSSLSGNYIQGTPDECHLPDYRDLTVNTNNLPNRGVSELYMRQLLMMETSYTSLTIGDASTDTAIFESAVEINGPTSFNGNLTITGTTTFSGGIVISGDLELSSDKRLKKNIRLQERLMDKIRLLDPVVFDWKKDNRKSYGFLAQDVAKLFPTMVSRQEDTGLLAIRYIELISVAFQGVKELDKEIEELKKEAVDLKQENNHLREDLSKMKDILCSHFKNKESCNL
jgi:prepilin-type N-terminal cleavage/methylation domain-containing protein